MEVTAPNDVKIYNLSAGKALPEWISERRRRLLQKKDVDVRRRIELIQDFRMPGLSSCIRLSRDGQYILATGVYKPRVRCYDVNQLSMKFERCFDSEVMKFEILSDDYSKIVFLQCDRHVEFHVQYGRYYRIRIPKFGNDLAYHYPSCDLYLVGASPEIYRLNLEQGRFLSSFQTDARSINCCVINPVHQLLTCGTDEGRIEAWDPRSRFRVGCLDCAFSSVTEDTEVSGLPSVTALSCRDGLTMAVGTATGQVLLYDVRSSKPLLVKDHMYGLPIKDVAFHDEMDLVLSMDCKVVKIWERNSGQAYTAIQPNTDLNNLCVVPKTGMIFIANEDKKILTYYIPRLGPAPKWCSFLDSLTEELEESNQNLMYDDYKFVTKAELNNLGLSHLIGSNLLRAYMHGYFLSIRLYHKAKTSVQPFAYDDYRKKKIREKIEDERKNRVMIHRLPQVNRDLAQKLLLVAPDKKKKTPDLMEDSRFKALFENPDFQVDEASEEYRLIQPLIGKLDKLQKAQRTTQKPKIMQQFQLVEDESDENTHQTDSYSTTESSDDDQEWTREIKQQHHLLRQETRLKKREEDANTKLQPQFYELKTGKRFTTLEPQQEIPKEDRSRASLGERLEMGGEEMVTSHIVGSRSMTFRLTKTREETLKDQALKSHQEDKTKKRAAPAAARKPYQLWRSRGAKR